MMRFLLFLLAIIWGLGILDQKIQSGINKGLGEVSTFTWHQADASSMLTFQVIGNQALPFFWLHCPYVLELRSPQERP
jgi:hypothetical protein